jgi:hypothetical protein
MRIFCASTLLLCALMLSGCTAAPVMTTNNSTPSNPAQGAALKGRVHGGQSPVSGATIQLWQVGTQGDGTAAAALISGAALTTSGEALTDANGNFDITGQYTCPSSTTLVYLTATGGNPGLSGGSINNSALVLMAAMGQCGSLASLTGPIVINEVTTVASIYALAQFTGGGGSGGNVAYYAVEPQTLTGLSTAFAEALNMIDIYTGTAQTSTNSGVGYVPQAEINTLANILVPCVNTSGPGSSNCQSLFTAAQPSGGNAPTTVLGAALDIARNPGNNVAEIYGLAAANAAFQPALTAAPNDWTVALSYSVGGINYPYGMALDAQGNVWVSGWVGNSPLSPQVGVISPTGVEASNSPYTNSANVSSPTGIAVDTSGNTWVANCISNGTVAFKLQNNTISVSYGPFSVAGMSCPVVAAVDSGGNVWFTNNGNADVIDFKSPFSNTNYDTYSGGGLDKPIDISFFARYTPSLVNSVWLANSGSDSLSEFNITSGGTGSGAVSNNYTGGGLSDPSGIAVDSAGNMWAIGKSANQVAEFTDAGTAVSPIGGWTGGGLDGPSRIAIDGGNNVWITNVTNSSITELNNSGTPITPSTGYQSSTLQGPVWIAVDASGNVWAVNTTESAPGYETVTVFLGVASPAAMPVQEALPIV